MRYVAAYLLAVLGSNTSPKSSDIEKILSSVGIESDSEKLNKVISELSGKNVEELIQTGMHYLFQPKDVNSKIFALGFYNF